MKFIFNKYFVIFSFIIITNVFIFSKNVKTLKNKNNNTDKEAQIEFTPITQVRQEIPQNQMMHFYATNAKTYVPFARLAYCQRPIIEKFSCGFCNQFAIGNYNPYFIHSVVLPPNRAFQLLILYSDIKKEVVISFSGPSSEHGNFFTSIFLEGFIIIPQIGNLKVEKVYWEIYSQHFRNLLIEKIRKFLSFGRADYKFIFVGHSFGGSIATLASFDLVYNRIIPKNPLINSPQVFTYGQLRIGDSDYINRLNTEIKIVRVIKKDDYIAHMPNCVFLNGQYKCFDTSEALIRVMPRLKVYIDSCGNPKTFFSFLETKKKFKSNNKNNNKKDPIIRGTTMIGGNLVPTHRPIFYTQPLGTELLYARAFDRVEKCTYVNGIPVCEKQIKFPTTFIPDVHRLYYNINMELC